MKYLEKLNGTTKVLISLAAFLALAFTFDKTYARASEVTAIQTSVATVVDVLKMQYISRKAVLELKREQGGLTPSEAVELTGLIAILDTFEKRGQ